ncbi:DUF4352 domain-containing protein [Spongiactinospora sp. TRM90649]|uniref:DUF4352 domain-containing protein n=1 Tax=Spongiactinospora sp. TRM90649 TaxID=3031114 RepID=UPI0023F6B107|nr:DUF4352 domain-containing protein [Spongiactinospora sp. TRM90649]MDF5751540.1 DUF4352 domain-containing protein [Spongiactinospora sp. TRM90649]
MSHPHHPRAVRDTGPQGRSPAYWLVATGAPILLLFGCTAVATGALRTPPRVFDQRDPIEELSAVYDAPPAAGRVAQVRQDTRPARLGETIMLRGSGDVEITVTAKRVVNTGTPASDLLRPKSGHRYYAVELTIGTRSSVPYTGVPADGAVVSDADGNRYPASAIGDVREGVPLGSLSIAPGDSRKGLVVFEVPEKARISALQLGLDTGFTDQPAEWHFG